jgi:prepilin-type N-terminal cleavage/methylation domain-containing protein
MNSKKLQKAYTIIEMMTVIAIVLIMTTVFASLNRPQKRFALQRNIYSFSASARRVQEMSMSIATVKVGSTELVPVGGYGLQISADPTDDANKKYYLYYNALNQDLTYDTGEAIENSPLKLTDGVYVSKIEGNNGTITDIKQLNVIFYPPDPKILMFYEGSPTNELQSAIITLKMADTNYIRKIHINKLGLISVDQKQQEDTNN